MSYINKEYSYIPIDSEVINYLNWIGDIPTSRFSIEQRTGYFDKKAHKKISVYLIKEDEKTKLMSLSGVKRYPMRVKCATIAWHALASAMDYKKDEDNSEKFI